MLDPNIEQALESNRPVEQLRDLARQRLKQGGDHPAILAEFEEARRYLREAGREKDEDTVMDVMDLLVGWCSPHVKL